MTTETTDTPEVPVDIFPRRRLGLLTLCLASFLIVVDNLIINVALPTLVRELDATTTDLQWIVDSYTLVLAGLLLTAGSAVDRYGRKRGLILGVGLFALFSVYAAYTTTPTQLITARALMGIGAAIIFPATLASITNLFPEPKERAKAIALWTAATGLGLAAGPLIGGWLLEHFWWGSIFFINVFFAVAIVIGAIFGVRESFDPHPRRFDPIGMILSIAAVGTLVWAIIEAPIKGWASTPILTAFGMATVGIAGFIFWELWSSHPMLDVRFFTRRGFTSGNLVVVVVFLSGFGAMFVGIQYLQFVVGLSPLEAGVRLFPLAVSTGVAALPAHFFVKKSSFKLTVFVGMLFSAAGLWVASTLTVDSGYWNPIGFALILLGIGLGLSSAPATDAVMASLPARDTGVGSATNDTTRELGGALGVAIAGSALASVYGDKIVAGLTGTPATPEVIESAKGSIGAAKIIAGLADQKFGVAAGDFMRELADSAFVQGTRHTFVVMACIVTVAAVLVAFVSPKTVQPVLEDQSDGEHAGTDLG